MTTNTTNKIFLVNVYCMYDGKEFPAIDIIKATGIEEATKEAENRCKNGDYSFDTIDEIDNNGYWSDCGAHVVRVKAVTEISSTTYEEIKNLI